jgi:hypothetical protein
VPPAADELEKSLERDRAGLGHLRPGWTAPSHGDDDRVHAAGQRGSGDLARGRGLAGALAGSDHGDGRDAERRAVDRRVEPEVAAHVREASDERDRDELHAFAITEHGLVGHVENRFDCATIEPVERARQRGSEIAVRLDQRKAELEVLPGAELLRSTEEQRRNGLETARTRGLERPTRHRWVVLAVDENEDLHLVAYRMAAGANRALRSYSPICAPVTVVRC